MTPLLVGIEIGGTKLQVVTGEPSGAITARFRFAVDRAQGAAGIRQHIQTTLAQVQQRHRLAGLGVGFGGPIDWATGRICCSHHVEGWSDFPLGEWLHSLTQAPVRVDNDANVAALGEARAGAGAGRDPVFYITLGSGVGGGLVNRGTIYHGAVPGEAEIGHVRLDRAGATIESRCAGWAVDRRVREAIAREPAGLLARLATGQEGAEARHLGPALQQGDAAAQRILRETCEDLAFGLSHVVHLFHPEVVVIGGGLSLLGEPLRAGVAATLPQFLMTAFAPGPSVALAALGEDAVPVGALALAARPD